MFYTYVLQNNDDESDFYIGCTSDLKERFRSHNLGKNRYTRGKQWKVVYYEAYLTLSAARKSEYHLKQDGRARRFLMERLKESLAIE